MEIRTLAEGLEFPEGPVALSDGSVVLVEIAAGTVTRVSPDGGKAVVARLGGGPNSRQLMLSPGSSANRCGDDFRNCSASFQFQSVLYRARFVTLPSPSQPGAASGMAGVSSTSPDSVAGLDGSTKINPSWTQTGWVASRSRAGSMREDKSGSTSRPSAANSQP